MRARGGNWLLSESSRLDVRQFAGEMAFAARPAALCQSAPASGGRAKEAPAPTSRYLGPPSGAIAA